jgi:hypothetical protein
LILAIVGTSVAAGGAQKTRSLRKVEIKVIKMTEVREAEPGKTKGAANTMSIGGNCPPGLKIKLELSGPAAGKATHYGLLKLADGIDDRGTKILLTGGGYEDPTEEYVAIDREQMFFFLDKPPTDTLWIELAVTLPARDAKVVNLKGELKLKISDRKTVTVADVAGKTGPITDKLLDEAGVKCEITAAEGESLNFKVTGKPDRLLEFNVFNAAGESISQGYSSNQFDDAEKTYELMLGEPLRDGAKLELVVAVGEEIIDVPIEIRKLALP